MLLLLLACTGDKTPISGAPCGEDDVDVTEMLLAAIAGTADACQKQALQDYTDGRAADEHGPWEQDIHVALSDDGVTFTEIAGAVAVETAAVPEVVHADGRYWLFHVNGSFDRLNELAAEDSTWMRTHGIPGIGALGLAVSDDGLSFVDVPEFEVQGLVEGMVVDPDVVRLPDGSWRLYYLGLTVEEYVEYAEWQEGEQHEVYSAVSTDLIHWTQEGVVFRGPYADPSVLCFDDGLTCVMASFGLDWSRSGDGGLHFQYEGPWEVDGFAPELVPLVDGTIRAFYNDKDLGAALRSLHSLDGSTWIPEVGVRMETYGEAVTLAGGPEVGWRMYFHTFKDLDDLPF